MSYSPLFDIIVNLVMFLELSEDSVIDPDAAVGQMEFASHSLTNLDSATKHLLLEHVGKMIDLEKATVANEEKLEFLNSFGENFGLIEV